MAKLRKENPTGVAAWALMAHFGLALWSGFAVPVQAQSSASISVSQWAANDHARLRLISAVSATGQGETLTAGLEFRMAPGWKIYWRSPGDAGFPPTIDWRDSSNLAGARLHWPVPQRYEIFGLTTYVYQDSVVLPLTVSLREAGAPLALRGQIAYLLCDRICIPYEAVVSLDLPAGQAEPSEFAPLIASYQARIPRRIQDVAGADGLTIERALLTRHGPGAVFGGLSMTQGATLEVLARSNVPFSQPDIIAEGPSPMGFGAPRVDLSEGGHLALLRMPVSLPGSASLLYAPPLLTLTLFDGARAVEQALTPQATGSSAVADPTMFGILLLALLGGFILNFMPCVLPVLSLKLMNAVAQSGRGARQMRASFLATALGIVMSLAALGGIVIGLKSLGLAVGWGVQFQQPIFLIVMALVVTLFAANLWGLFVIPLPQAIGAAAGRAPIQGLAGDFATGVLATFLATPCSAPFLGTAVGFALTHGVTEILAVFTALGLGLALPYLVVAAALGVARILPKPGGWMVGLRRVLGAVLAATAAWLITVLSVLTGWPTALAVAVALLAVLLGLWIHHRQARSSAARVAAASAVIAFAVAALALPFIPRAGPGPIAASDTVWQAFDRVQVFNAVAQGKVVLVDVTADWCITCQANKTLVLDRGKVRARIDSGEILTLRADWTRPNRAIADYLAGFGRYGIPFNAVYGPGAPSGIALPELLREEDVLAAFDKATKPAGGG